MSLRYSVTCQMSFFKRQRSVVGTWNTVVPEISKILWDPAGTPVPMAHRYKGNAQVDPLSDLRNEII